MKRLCSLLIVIALLLILFAGGTPKVQKNLEYRLTEKGSDIAVRDPSPSIAVFTEEGDFNTFYNYLHMNKIPLPGPPEIDFSGSLLLFVSYGEQRTAGYFIMANKEQQDISSRLKRSTIEKALLWCRRCFWVRQKGA